MQVPDITVPSGTEKKRRGRPKGSKDITPRKSMENRRAIMTSRGKELLAESQDAMRERLIGQGHIQRLEQIQQQLQGGAASDSLTSTQIQALGRSADISLRLLAKVLPDLRSVEVTKRTEELLTIEQVPAQQRDAIARAIEEALGMGGQGGNHDPAPENTTP